MYKITEIINHIYKVRIQTLDDPSKGGFKPNRHGVMHRILNRKALLPGGTAAKITVYYADQNPRKSSYEAKMVQNGLWTNHDVAWLWGYLNGKFTWLAKRTPEETKAIGRGSRVKVFSDKIWRFE